MQQKNHRSPSPSGEVAPGSLAQPLNRDDDSDFVWSQPSSAPQSPEWQSFAAIGSDLTFTPGVSLSAADLVSILKRRRNILIYSVVLAAVLGLLVSLLTPATYESTGLLLVEPPSMRVSEVSAGDPLSDLFSGTRQQYKMQTQVMILQSQSMREETRKTLRLKNVDALPEFAVESLPESDVIRIDATGNRAQLTASAVDALMNMYIRDVGDADGRELSKALTFVESGMSKAQGQLQSAESRLSAFKSHRGISDLDKNRSAQFESVERVKMELQTVQSQVDYAHAQIAALEAQIRSEPQVEVPALPTDTDPQVQQAEGRLAERQADLEVMRTRYTPDNRKIALLTSEVAALHHQVENIRMTAPKRMTRINSRYESLRAQLATLQTTEQGLTHEAAEKGKLLAQERTKLAQYPTWEQQFAQLQRDFDIAQANYILFSAKREDLRLRRETRRVNASVMQAATVPTSPIAPNRLADLFAAVGLGIFLGLFIAMMLEYIDDRVNTVDDLSRTTPLPVLSTIPHIAEEGLRLAHVVRGFSPVAEAYRALRTSILFASIDNPLRTLMLTSSAPSEGKSTTIANLAAAMTANGKRVIIVDADLRHPTQHKLFKVDRGVGLTDVLIGSSTLDDALLQPTEDEHLRLLTAGSVAPNPTEMLGSETMAHLIDSLRQRADIILIDSPPTLAISDAPLLAARVDGVLFVVAMGEAKRGGVRGALDMLQRSRARLIGVVLNKMDESSFGYKYGYGYAPAESSDAEPVSIGSENGLVSAGSRSRPTSKSHSGRTGNE